MKICVNLHDWKTPEYNVYPFVFVTTFNLNYMFPSALTNNDTLIPMMCFQLFTSSILYIFKIGIAFLAYDWL